MQFLNPSTWLGSVVILVAALVISMVLVEVFRLLFLHLSGRAKWVGRLARRVHVPTLIFVLVVVGWVVSAMTEPGELRWWPGLSHAFLIATIVSGAWLLAILVSSAFDRVIANDADATDPDARSRRTQLVVLYRLSLVLISVLALGAVLFSFPAMRVIGTSLLASAGIVSVVAGLAAQSLLSNLIAGIQIAFSEAIKVGDVVVVEDEFGHIGEINLSYVVVYIWDERRLILPCTYFTTKPFETWTRNSDKILGVVLMDLDWRVPVDAVRAKFQQIIESSDNWDHRKSSVNVIEAQNGYVTIRFVISAQDSDKQFALRCEVREQIMTWLQQEHPEALPTTRILKTNTSAGGQLHTS